MSGAEIRKLYLVLTARCNLTCSYCYQNEKTARRMSWETLQRALDLGMSSVATEIEFVFFGGEPLLEFPLMQRAIAYVERRARPGLRVSYGTITNGTLLTDEVVEFLLRHHVDTQLSFDGVPQAQDRRGKGTFAILDGRMRALRDAHPDFFDRLTVSITLPPSGIDTLADSIDYFLERRVRRVAISPTFTNEPGWDRTAVDRLNEQFRRIVNQSLVEYAETGEIPVLVMRKAEDEIGRGSGGLTMCGVSSGETPTVDVDGQMHGCATFAESFQGFRRAFLSSRIEPLRLGAVDEIDYARAQKSYPSRVKSARLFHDKEKKHSSLAECGSCQYLTRCSVCPMSIGHQPGNSDPHRIPDFLCAYNLVSLRHQDRFESRRHLDAAATRRHDLLAFASSRVS